MTATTGNLVKVHYTGRLANGETFDSSADREPLEFRLGSGMVIDGFDSGILGMAIGEKKTIEIPCENAYGPRNEEYIVKVARENLGLDFQPEIGMHLQMPMQNGDFIPVTITDLDENDITLDANPPLAGLDLIFDLELVGILSE